MVIEDQPSIPQPESQSQKTQAMTMGEFNRRSEAALAEFERLLLVATRALPPDYKNKPLDWWIIGTVLLSQPGYMSNRQLARLLDRSRFLKCPYGPTWINSISEADCKKFINKVRKWVIRPGKNWRSIPSNHAA